MNLCYKEFKSKKMFFSFVFFLSFFFFFFFGGGGGGGGRRELSKCFFLQRFQILKKTLWGEGVIRIYTVCTMM